MNVQELLKRIEAMGFEEVAVQYNATHHTEWCFVFVGRLPVGPNYIGEDQAKWEVTFAGPFEGCGEDEEALLRFFMFLKWTLGLNDRSMVSRSSTSTINI